MRTAYFAARLRTQLVWWGRGAVVVALGLVGTALAGWVTGLHQLTKIFGNWPPITPWTILLVSALAISIVLQSGRVSGVGVWVGRGLAVAVGVMAVVFLVEYATGRSFGVDLVWFPDGVRALQATWPGRPSPRTAIAALGLSVAVGLTRVDRRGAAVAWGLGLASAAALSVFAVAAYMFGALSVVVTTPSTGMAISTALCLVLLVFAACVVRPDRKPVAWLLARPDRVGLGQMAGVIAGGPVLTALLHGFLTIRGVDERPSWMLSILTATSVMGAGVFAILERERRTRREGEVEFESIVTNAPIAIAVRSVEHGYEFANKTFSDLFGLADPGQLVGLTADDVASQENLATSGPFAELTGNLRDTQAAVSRGEAGTFVQEIAVGVDRLTYDFRVFPIRVERGQAFSIGLIGTDVTQRVRVERGLRERLEFEEAISHAIDSGRLVVFSQPIVDAHTGQLIEEELLVRMKGSGDEMLTPDSFLPQAQRFGLMPAIDRFMVASGLELARAGRHVAVNLSAESISDRETIDAIVDELRKAGDAATRVSFEITETTALASNEISERFSEDMRTLGCRVALDDFGTGYGTFTDLRGLTLHKLKIDRSFVSGLLSSKQDESVVRMIVGIAREFGLVTTAEGVDDAETRIRLIELGVDQLQGYLIGTPAPATAK